MLLDKKKAHRGSALIVAKESVPSFLLVDLQIAPPPFTQSQTLDWVPNKS